MSLSDKIVLGTTGKEIMEGYRADDVKQFIKELKERLNNVFDISDYKLIDELAGEGLI